MNRHYSKAVHADAHVIGQIEPPKFFWGDLPHESLRNYNLYSNRGPEIGISSPSLTTPYGTSRPASARHKGGIHA